MTQQPTRVTVNGVTYESISACCRAFDIGANRVSAHRSRYPEATVEDAINHLLSVRERGGKVGPRKPTTKPLIEEADIEAFDADNVVRLNPATIASSRDVINLTPKEDATSEIKIQITISLPKSLRNMFGKLASR